FWWCRPQAAPSSRVRIDGRMMFMPRGGLVNRTKVLLQKSSFWNFGTGFVNARRLVAEVCSDLTPARGVFQCPFNGRSSFLLGARISAWPSVCGVLMQTSPDARAFADEVPENLGQMRLVCESAGKRNVAERLAAR